ncbi:MAG: type I methionyl aminopeptidase [Oligosphaeraceae bacterium]|nr:type I methionyl aminopeptidase [Oligosphaeraceae bacterium]
MSRQSKIIIYREPEISKVRAAAQASAQVLDRLCIAANPGMSTWQLDQLAISFIQETGGKSAFYGYNGFPGQICISINEEVVHGIGRKDRIIMLGDLLSIDVGVALDGYIGDNARTICVGRKATGAAAKLLQTTEESLYAGIAAATPRKYVRDIGAAVQKVVEKAGMHVVRELVGHGCGRKMHEPPEVPNFKTPGASPILQPGMIICIEPMVNMGTHRVVFDRQDHWTVRSMDASLSAHFEHQILITENQPEILTRWPKTV